MQVFISSLPFSSSFISTFDFSLSTLSLLGVTHLSFYYHAASPSFPLIFASFFLEMKCFQHENHRNLVSRRIAWIRTIVTGTGWTGEFLNYFFSDWRVTFTIEMQTLNFAGGQNQAQTQRNINEVRFRDIHKCIGESHADLWSFRFSQMVDKSSNNRECRE